MQGVSALAAEIAAADPDAIVIADGVNGVLNVYTFQSMKGLNGLERKESLHHPHLARAEQIRGAERPWSMARLRPRHRAALSGPDQPSGRAQSRVPSGGGASEDGGFRLEGALERFPAPP